jgi:hypothetical protein
MALNNVDSSVSVFTSLPAVSKLTHCPKCGPSTNFRIKMIMVLWWTLIPDQSSKLLLALASPVILGIGLSLHSFNHFGMGPPLRREGSDSFWSPPSTGEWLLSLSLNPSSLWCSLFTLARTTQKTLLSTILPLLLEYPLPQYLSL